MSNNGGGSRGELSWERLLYPVDFTGTLESTTHCNSFPCQTPPEVIIQRDSKLDIRTSVGKAPAVAADTMLGSVCCDDTS